MKSIETGIFLLFKKIFFLGFIYLSNFYTQLGAGTQRPRDQESHVPLTEPARCPLINVFKWNKQQWNSGMQQTQQPKKLT